MRCKTRSTAIPKHTTARSAPRRSGRSSMTEAVLTIKAGQSLDQDAPLPGTSRIAAVKVDNPAGGPWLNFPDVGRTVAPGTNGVVIPYRLSTKRIHVTTTPPTGQQNPTAGLAATLT